LLRTGGAGGGAEVFGAFAEGVAVPGAGGAASRVDGGERVAFFAFEAGAEGGEGAQRGAGGVLGDEVGAVGGDAFEGVDGCADVRLVVPGCELREGHAVGVGEHCDGEAGIGEHAEELVVLAAVLWVDVHACPHWVTRGKEWPST
jgi:hypothetical protein